LKSSHPFTGSAELATKPEPLDSPFALSLWFAKLTTIGLDPTVLSLSKDKLIMNSFVPVPLSTQ
jgi:hypothetical protein